MNKLAALLLSFLFVHAFGQDIPTRPDPPRLVNDFAGVLSNAEAQKLEQKLDRYNDTTSTQIAVVIVKNINGYEPVDYAFRIGESWGVGQKKDNKNNGVVILVSIDDRKDAIVTGYGMEGSITDLAARRVRETYMHPYFRKGDFYSGLDEATTALMKLATGEFRADDIRTARKSNGSIFWLFIIFIFIFISIMSKVGRTRRNHFGSKGMSFWTSLWLLSNLGGGRHHNNDNWGGGFGGGESDGGGFGGFGGGSFGGGGSGGSW